MTRTQLKLLVASSLYLLLIACGGDISTRDRGPDRAPDVSNVPNAIPRDEPKSKYGNPAHYDVLGKRYYTLASSKGYNEKGVASWYGEKFHGRRTSNGEIYDMYAMTAAHKTLPLPTYVEVTNLENGRKIIVKVNDRGPFHGDRLIDLSYTAAKKLDILSHGTGRVRVRTVIKNNSYTSSSTPVTEGSATRYAGLYLQVGAFSTSILAEQLKAKLQRQIGATVFIVPLKQAEGNLYRVRVGPLANVEYGDALARQLVELGFYDAHIVIE